LAKTQVPRVMLATASYAARLASDIGLLATTSSHSPEASDVRTTTGLLQFSPTRLNSLMLSL